MHTITDDSARQTDYLSDIVEKVSMLPLGWALLSAVLLMVAFCLFGFALLIVVLMIKAFRMATTVLATRDPTHTLTGSPPT